MKSKPTAPRRRAKAEPQPPGQPFRPELHPVGCRLLVSSRYEGDSGSWSSPYDIVVAEYSPSRVYVRDEGMGWRSVTNLAVIEALPPKAYAVQTGLRIYPGNTITAGALFTGANAVSS